MKLCLFMLFITSYACAQDAKASILQALNLLDAAPFYSMQVQTSEGVID